MTLTFDHSLFDLDEMNLRHIDPNWTPDDLLRQDGVFFLKDVVKVLKMPPFRVPKLARALMEDGHNPWEVMGVRKIWNHWLVRMKVFAPYYRQHLVEAVLRVDSSWDANTLLQQKGTFFLAEVCKRFPFRADQIRYQAKKNRRSGQTLGVWQDPESQTYLVDMERFGAWVRKIWTTEFGRRGFGRRGKE